MKRGKTVFASLALSLSLALSACSDGGDTATVSGPDLNAAPANATWQVGPAGLSFPVSTDSGPSSSTPVPHGWEDSPQGAVLAAMTTQVFLSGADDELWPAVSQTLVEPGPGRDQWAQARALVSVQGTLDNAPVMEAFKVNEFSDENDSAIVTVAARYPNGTVAGVPVQLSRSSGDWRVVLPTQEQAPDLVELNADQLADFTTFSPVAGEK